MNNSYNQPPGQNGRNRRGHPFLVVVLVLIVIVCIVSAGFALFRGFRQDAAAVNAQTGSSNITIQQTTGSAGRIDVTDVSDVVDIARPSVVEIVTETISNGDSIFGQYVSQGAGSGVIMSEDGYIITNNHVIADANSIEVTLADGNTYDAVLVGTDAPSDLAVIKINASNLPAATFGDSDSLKVGNAAIAIGNPLGSLGGTVTTGIISALDREITIDGETMTLLQTDAAINPGNSGGGLFDANGNLIGIVNAKQSASGIEGLGFAIPINGAVDVLNDLIAHGSVTSRPALNVSLQDVPANYNGMNEGVYIAQIVEGGSADKAGLEVGDQILTFDGKDVSTAQEVKNILRKHKVGDQIDVTVDRNGRTINETITLQSSSLNQ